MYRKLLLILLIIAVPFLTHGEGVATTTPKFPKEIVRGDTSKKQVIFTFDGGSGVDSLPQILATLEKHKVKGTFFLTGKTIENFPASVKKINNAGFEIFNHTYSHPHLPTLKDKNILEQFSKVDEVLAKINIISTKPYFRAPYGERNNNILKIAGDAGYTSVYWTLDCLDWKPGETDKSVKKRILSHVANGNIYLMHLGDKITGNILDEVFTEIESRGYKIVSLTQGI